MTEGLKKTLESLALVRSLVKPDKPTVSDIIGWTEVEVNRAIVQIADLKLQLNVLEQAKTFAEESWRQERAYLETKVYNWERDRDNADAENAALCQEMGRLAAIVGVKEPFSYPQLEKRIVALICTEERMRLHQQRLNQQRSRPSKRPGSAAKPKPKKKFTLEQRIQRIKECVADNLPPKVIARQTEVSTRTIGRDLNDLGWKWDPGCRSYRWLRSFPPDGVTP